MRLVSRDCNPLEILWRTLVEVERSNRRLVNERVDPALGEDADGDVHALELVNEERSFWK
jgi:hypothetical protein